MELNEKALDAALDANLDYLYRGSGPKPNKKERKDFKDNAREETIISITAYLKALG